ncbi:MAG: hypothetical protein KDK39_00585 [Leptospiraceae bacterium]|nr:hypothetical protein [Leptospiraceae bacterium]
MLKLNRNLAGVSALLLLSMLLAACETTSYARKFVVEGATTPEGRPRGYQSTTTRALHLALGVQPLLGDASLDQAIANFEKEARKKNAKSTRITNVDRTNLWFILPPFSFLISPVFTEINGYVY